jgi:putative transposase
VERYQTIQELHREKGCAIVALCTLAGVARSAYYKWLRWIPSARESELRMLPKEVKRRYDKRAIAKCHPIQSNAEPKVQ